jgi:hypothetical protein
MNDRITKLVAALEYARLGYQVFLLKPRGKIPLIPKTEGGNGHKDATTDEAIIRGWWGKALKANIGIRCNGLLVADFDGRKGAESLKLMQSEHGELPATWIIKTGGGTEAEPKEQGLQYVYTAPAELNIRPGAGKYGYDKFDIRANDSYICAEPSVTRLSYETIGGSPDKLAPAPAWLIEIAQAGNQGNKPISRPIAELKDGHRHADLIGFIGKWRARGFNESEIEVQALALNATSEKPLPETEVLEMCAQYRGSETSRPDRPKPFDWRDHAITHVDLLEKTLQPISFLVADILIDTGTGILAGRKKLGKSFLATQLSQSVASGANFIGHRVKQGKVVHFALEDGERRTQSRLWMQKAEKDLPITYFYKWPAWNTPAGFNQLRAMLSELKPALVVVDTFAKILDGKPDQNAAGVMAAFGNQIHDLALELNLMILFIAHHGKGLQMTTRDPGFDIRGSSAIPGATDVNIGIYKNEDATFELIGEGRDIAEFDLRVSFDKAVTWAWQLEGEAQDLRRQEAEAKILEALDLLGETDASAIAKQTETSRVAVNGHLKRMRSYEDASITYKTKGNKILYSLPTLTDKQSLLPLQQDITVRDCKDKTFKTGQIRPVRVVRDVYNNGVLPDCPDCGLNEWTYSPDDELVCPCGKSLKGGVQ